MASRNEVGGNLQPGAVVAGRFELQRELGRGGMGSVWVAKQLALDTPCAVKFIEAEVATKAPGARERFEREAKAAAQLRSPHVVQILDYGLWEKQPYIAMELLDGENLAERLMRCGRLTPEETIAVLWQVSRALTKAHAQGIVHRDLKPENVFLVHDDDRDVVKVLDFGIAKTSAGTSFTRTATGQILGTPYYMSPEQAEGTQPLDFRSDLWSLGVIAFECLVGAPPFESEALGDLLNRIMNKPLPVPSAVAPHVAPGFDAWFARACARPVHERFQSAKELVQALAESLGVTIETGRRESSAAPSNPKRTRSLALQTTTPNWDHTVEAAPLSLERRTFMAHARSSGDLAPTSRLRRALVVVGAAVALGALVLVMATRSTETEVTEVPSVAAAPPSAPIEVEPSAAPKATPVAVASTAAPEKPPPRLPPRPSSIPRASAAPADSNPDPGF